MTPKLRRFLDRVRPSTPYLVVDVDVVEANYLALASALDGVQIFYAVKANPAPEILSRLASFGCSFDVASPGEVAMALANGAAAAADRIAHAQHWQLAPSRPPTGRTLRPSPSVASAKSPFVPPWRVSRSRIARSWPCASSVTSRWPRSPRSPAVLSGRSRPTCTADWGACATASRWRWFDEPASVPRRRARRRGSSESAELLLMARELERLDGGAIRPSDGFTDRVLGAIADEPLPRPMAVAGVAAREGRLGAMVAALRDTWHVAWSGGRPLAARAQAMAFVVLLVVAVGSVGAVTTVGAINVLFSTRSTPSVAPEPSLPAVVARPRRRTRAHHHRREPHNRSASNRLFRKML